MSEISTDQQCRSVSLNSGQESNAHFIKRKNKHKHKQTRHINIKQIKIKVFQTFNWVDQNNKLIDLLLIDKTPWRETIPL